MIGSLSSLFILLLITNSIFLYILFVELNNNVEEINSKILELQADTQNKISGLTENIVQTNQELKALGSQLGSIDEEISLLKASTSEDFSGIIEDAVKAVVTIRTDVGQGTGFIITEDGYLVTNAHVLSGGREVEAINYEQDIIGAEFIGYESNLDIALLKIEGNYDKLTLDNSNMVQVGEKVIAIGNPLGLQFSVSEGIVSAIHRTGLGDLEAYIQTDAALNPGNSGGPLINKEGKVIGINNFKVGTGENLGFALESNYIKEAVNNIAEKALNQTLI